MGPAGAVIGTVAPLVGVWIEIKPNIDCDASAIVAPLVGVWIEIRISCLAHMKEKVAPLVGVWIEILLLFMRRSNANCRSPRGSVD